MFKNPNDQAAKAMKTQHSLDLSAGKEGVPSGINNSQKHIT